MLKHRSMVHCGLLRFYFRYLQFLFEPAYGTTTSHQRHRYQPRHPLLRNDSGQSPPLDWCHPHSPASSGLNKSSHFRWEFTPISQNALLLLVSGNMSPNLIVPHQQRAFPSKYRISNEKIPAKICKFWIDQWRPWSQSPCSVLMGWRVGTALVFSHRPISALKEVDPMTVGQTVLQTHSMYHYIYTLIITKQN